MRTTTSPCPEARRSPSRWLRTCPETTTRSGAGRHGSPTRSCGAVKHANGLGLLGGTLRHDPDLPVESSVSGPSRSSLGLKTTCRTRELEPPAHVLELQRLCRRVY